MFDSTSRKILLGVVSGTLFSTTVALAASDKPTYYLMDSQGNPVLTKQPDCVLTPKTPNLPAKPLEICGDIIDRDGDGVPDDEDVCPTNTPEEIAKGVYQTGPRVGCSLDTDKDNVPDYRDDCPDNTSSEISKGVDARGCPPDSDNDGVLDYTDRCPGTQYGIKVDEQGCSLDTDRDGVADYKDQCPGSGFGVEVDSRGCALPPPPPPPPPAPPPPPEPKGAVALDGKVLFDFDRDDLTYAARSTLDGLINQAGGVESIEHVKIEAHADDQGSEEYNQLLSEKRAASVANYFIMQGLSYDKMRKIGDGERNPVCYNTTEECRTQNRRADITVTHF